MENNTLQIQISENKQNTIVLNQFFAKENKVAYLRETILRFGIKTAECDIEINESLDNNTILISDNIMKKMMIPAFADYQLKTVNNELILGPVIGILVGQTNEVLYKRIRLLENHVRHYQKIGGLICAFTLDEMNKNDLTVEGIIYNYKKGVWEKSTIPYPSSILKRSSLNQEEREYFKSIYGDRIFNYKPIDKWGIYDRLSQFPELERYLPKTGLYKTSKDIINFLNEYKDIYVKPLGGNRGRGIYNIVKDNNTIYIRSREEGENIELVIENETDLTKFIKKTFKTNRYLIQETLDLQVENRSIDFRIGLDKNQSGNWQNNMFVTRISGENSIVSNVATSGGYVAYPTDALKQFYGYSEQEATEVEEKLKEIALLTAARLDQTGYSFGKLAFDIAIDTNKQIWIIEVNNQNPNDTILKGLTKNEEMHHEIKLQNMLYSKYLAGFSDKDVNEYYHVSNSNDNFILEEGEELRYLMHIGVPLKPKSYSKYVKSLAEDMGLKGTINKFSKFIIRIEIEGESSLLNKFINKARESKYTLKGFVIEEISPLGDETGMEIEKDLN
ncbi:Endospore coat-associated protein YheD [Oceanobacillus oncorhynchi]|uniref:Endospore coat-associated protein YheD n=1 Tax=Oceanobacillus oncorhynchi TaxID=545501 RepID=A0A0A1MCS3_9BACI|nr:YheC/YheD family protein [Oceanobacillus oncorhynchi]CEI80838.1 Endospore coat-associated protein YheD [Oceanobacillus oncorhynchi]